MSEQLRLQLQRSGRGAALLRSQRRERSPPELERASNCGPVEVVRAGERFEIALPSSGETLLEPLGPAIAFPEHRRTAWLCRAHGTAEDGQG